METAGLALAVLPLIVSALENYEYTFQPLLIFSHRHQREIERLQHSLRVQKATFANECCFLLHSVTSNRGNAMLDDLRHPLWQDEDLEIQLKERLEKNYDACVSALSLIDTLLKDILKETKIFDILKQRVRCCRVWSLGFAKSNPIEGSRSIQPRVAEGFATTH